MLEYAPRMRQMGDDQHAMTPARVRQTRLLFRPLQMNPAEECSQAPFANRGSVAGVRRKKSELCGPALSIQFGLRIHRHLYITSFGHFKVRHVRARLNLRPHTDESSG